MIRVKNQPVLVDIPLSRAGKKSPIVLLKNTERTTKPMMAMAEQKKTMGWISRYFVLSL